MKKILIVVDMQNDFIDGALGTAEAEKIVAKVVKKAENFSGEIIFTLDTHGADYSETQEGKKLPVPHCIKGTHGHELCGALKNAADGGKAFEKNTFGSKELAEYLAAENEKTRIDSITLVGLCTDICVISNALLIKAFLPEVNIRVDASCCAGVTSDSHENALAAMRSCQIEIEN